MGLTASSTQPEGREKPYSIGRTRKAHPLVRQSPWPPAKKRAGKSIVVVEDHQAVSEMLNIFVDVRANTFHIVAHATTGDDALTFCKNHAPDIIILEPMVADIAPIELVRHLLTVCPQARILVFTRSNCEDLACELMASGVHGIVSKKHPMATFATALEVISNRGCYFEESAERFLGAKKITPSLLTNREKDVLKLVAEGFSTKEIASRLGISARTTDKFRQRIMQKLNLHDAVQLTRYALSRGFASLN